MKTAMLGLLAETPIHPGGRRGMGVVDLPVAREASTDYPVLVGSSLKGALRDKAETGGAEKNGWDAEELFRKPDRTGDLAISDARLLLLPVLSLTASSRWATCPHLVERYSRDRAGLPAEIPTPCMNRGGVLAKDGDDSLFLDERRFATAGAPPRFASPLSRRLTP